MEGKGGSTELADLRFGEAGIVEVNPMEDEEQTVHAVAGVGNIQSPGLGASALRKWRKNTVPTAVEAPVPAPPSIDPTILTTDHWALKNREDAVNAAAKESRIKSDESEEEEGKGSGERQEEGNDPSAVEIASAILDQASGDSVAPSLADVVANATNVVKNVDQARELMRLYQWRKKRRQMLIQAFIWFTFLGVLLAQNYLAQDVRANYHMFRGLNDALVQEGFLFNDSQIRKTFFDIGQDSEFYQWLYGPLWKALTRSDDYTIYKYNSILGAVRLRQVRVTSPSCEVDEDYTDITQECWSDYRGRVESKVDYGEHNQFHYYTAKETGERRLWAMAPSSTMLFYPGSGFAHELPYPENGASDGTYSVNLRASMQYLEDNNWVDKQTRAIFIDVNVFNGNFNLFANCKMLVEMTAAGDVIPRFFFTPFRLNLYITPLDKFRAFLECIIIVFLVYFSFRVVFETILNFRSSSRVKGEAWWSFFVSPWNILEATTICTLWYVIFAMVIYMSRNHNLDFTEKRYYPIHPIGYDYVMFMNLKGFAMLLCFLSSFKYFQLIPRMLLLWSTLRLAAPELTVWFIAFAIIMGGFIAMGAVVFGPQLEGMQSWSVATTTGLQMFYKGADYDDLKLINRILGPFYYVLFILLVMFFLASMFFAILMEKFDAAKQLSSQSDDLVALFVGTLKSVPRKLIRIVKKLAHRRIEASDEELLEEFAYMSQKMNSELSSDGTLTQDDVEKVMGTRRSLGEISRTLSAYRTMRLKAGMSVAGIETIGPSTSGSSTGSTGGQSVRISISVPVDIDENSSDDEIMVDDDGEIILSGSAIDDNSSEDDISSEYDENDEGDGEIAPARVRKSPSRSMRRIQSLRSLQKSSSQLEMKAEHLLQSLDNFNKYGAGVSTPHQM